MKDQERTEALRRNLVKFLMVNAGESTEFVRGLLVGAIDALSWTVDDKSLHLIAFCQTFDKLPKTKRKPMKKAGITRDHFAV